MGQNGPVTESIILDILLVLMLIGYIAYGFRNGLSRSVFTLAGIIAGIVAAFFLAPVVANLVPVPFLRLGVTIVVAIGFVAVGHAVGSAIGRFIRRGILHSPLSGVDRVLGAIVTGVVAALVASMVAFSVSQLGVPVLSRAIAGSTVLRIVSTVTPDPVEAFLAQVRAAVVDGGIPIITSAIEGPAPEIPTIDTGSGALNVAAQSVVRISGNAYACGVAQHGSGFVVYDDRVVTNAHVVAGVTEPMVQVGDDSVKGTVVYYNSDVDIAVIDVPSLDGPAIRFDLGGQERQQGAVLGFPQDGPFDAQPVRIRSDQRLRSPDIYGNGTVTRHVFSLRGLIRPGNSGGPVVSTQGRVLGVVFAASVSDKDTGYALTAEQVSKAAAVGLSASEKVSSGNCV